MTGNHKCLKPQERVIVALDVRSNDEALELVDELAGLITFYKVGLELLMGAGMNELLRRLVIDNRVFVDLKLPGDIPETITRTVQSAAELGVTFVTLSHMSMASTIRVAVAARGQKTSPELLFVSFLSSLDRADFAELQGRQPSDFEAHLEQRSASMKQAGADGFIVSGQEIGLFRTRYPDAVLVSPGIRPSGSPLDDHKRSCTPAEAIRLGADYIVVGRPIKNAGNRRDAAQRIVDEVAQAADDGSARVAGRPSSGRSEHAHAETVMPALPVSQ